VIYTALQNGDVGSGLTALDLGCGTGMLTLGCALVECDHVIAIDCDSEALAIAKENVIDLELDDRVSFLVAKVANSGVHQSTNTKTRQQKGGGRNRHSLRGGRHSNNTPRQSEGSALILTDDDGIPLHDNCVDTVLTNPPFGTKHNAGMDVQFLRTATRLARKSVYSFHKSSTRDYILRKVSEWGMEATVVAQMKFDIPNTYKFHQRKSVDVEVDLLRVSLRQEQQDDHYKEATTIQEDNEVFDDGENLR
jgi:predicted RNA methylase